MEFEQRPPSITWYSELMEDFNMSGQVVSTGTEEASVGSRKKTLWKFGGLLILVLLLVGSFGSDTEEKENISVLSEENSQSEPESVQVTDSGSCEVKRLTKSNPQGIKIYSEQGDRYVINKEDADGTAQIYIGTTGGSDLVCVTCDEQPGGPKKDRFKMQPSWHPSGKWIFIAVERDEYAPPPVLGEFRDYVEGQLQNGIWTDMWAVSPDGKHWRRMTDFKSGVAGTADGYTGVAFTPDGRKAVWSQIMDGNILTYWPFGRWELTIADVHEQNGMPVFRNIKNITPAGMHWNEPGNFSPNNETLVLSGSVEKDAQGMDQYLLNIRTGELTNLTNSPTVWDEHGLFSPDGQKIVFMSAYPYRDNPDASKILSIKTEFMLMDKDGSNISQLTHFRTPGYPEYSDGIAAVATWSPSGDSLSARTLIFPNYVDWDLQFEGRCGNMN